MSLRDELGYEFTPREIQEDAVDDMNHSSYFEFIEGILNRMAEDNILTKSEEFQKIGLFKQLKEFNDMGKIPSFVKNSDNALDEAVAYLDKFITGIFEKYIPVKSRGWGVVINELVTISESVIPTELCTVGGIVLTNLDESLQSSINDSKALFEAITTELGTDQVFNVYQSGTVSSRLSNKINDLMDIDSKLKRHYQKVLSYAYELEPNLVGA